MDGGRFEALLAVLRRVPPDRRDSSQVPMPDGPRALPRLLTGLLAHDEAHLRALLGGADGADAG